MSDTDLDLLQQFARDHSQAAFTTLVQRHVNLVYSAALRQVRSPQLAEEVAQSVFADLARVAATPSSPFGRRDATSQTSLTPWLYTVTRRTAIDEIRKESRRQLREQIAVEMNNMNATANDWKQIEPLLDDAMAALDETDRSAILLRYFENKNLREVGEALGASEDAAQKRVSRAVERLRDFFSKRNVTIGAGGLVVLISANAVQAAPVGLAATISAAVLAGTAVHAATIITATKTIAMTIIQKTIITAALAAAVGTGIYEAHQAAQLRGQVQTLQLQQAPLAEQIRQLQSSSADATNRLADLIAENARLKSNLNGSELLRLRAEVTRLKNVEAKNAQTQTGDDPVEIAARKWLKKVKLLKQHVEQTPNENIPELQFATEKNWLDAAVSGDFSGNFEPNTDDEWRWDLRNLFQWVENDFGQMGRDALRKYIQSNNGQFPTDPSQLQQYFHPPVDEAILQRYEIVPASSIPKAEKLGDDWLVAQKIRTDVYEGREVFGARSCANREDFW